MTDSNNGIHVEASPSIKVSGNYQRLTSKPKINGVELNGNMTAAQLNIMTNDMSQYPVLSVLPSNAYVLVTSSTGETSKFRLKEATTGRITGGSIESAEVGNFIIKSITED